MRLDKFSMLAAVDTNESDCSTKGSGMKKVKGSARDRFCRNRSFMEKPSKFSFFYL
jgi:hypothetical protein